MGAVMGLLALAIGVVGGVWFSPSQATAPVPVGMSLSETESIRFEREQRPELERKLGATIVVKPIDRGVLVPTLDRMVATGTPLSWDLLSVDNGDPLEILAKKGLVEELPQDLLDNALPSDPLFQSRRETLRVDGRDYFVPLRLNVKVMYANRDLLSRAGHDGPPKTLEEWEKLAHRLASQGLGRVAIQAHPGKAAAATVFEWVTALGGDPLTLDGPEAREAF